MPGHLCHWFAMPLDRAASLPAHHGFPVKTGKLHVHLLEANTYKLFRDYLEESAVQSTRQKVLWLYPVCCIRWAGRHEVQVELPYVPEQTVRHSWGRRDLRHNLLSSVFLKGNTIQEKTAYSYKLGFLHKKEKNFLQSLLHTENLQCTSTEINDSRT